MSVESDQIKIPDWFLDEIAKKNAQKTQEDPLCIIFQSVADYNGTFANSIGLCNLLVSTQRYYTQVHFVR